MEFSVDRILIKYQVWLFYDVRLFCNAIAVALAM